MISLSLAVLPCYPDAVQPRRRRGWMRAIIRDQPVTLRCRHGDRRLSWLTFYFSAKHIDASSFYAQVAGFFGKLIAPSQYFVTCLFSKTTSRAWAGNLSSYKNCWRRACGADRRRIHTNASRPCGKDASATVSLARGGRVWRRHSHDQKAQARVLSRDGEYRWPRTAEGYEGQALCSANKPSAVVGCLLPVKQESGNKSQRIRLFVRTEGLG